jgi:hypothetical protein
MKTGTCVIFAITAEEIYVAADTQRNETEILKDGSELESKDYVCKILKAGRIYAASSGLNYYDDTQFYVQDSCKTLLDARRSIRENIAIIEAELYEKYYRTAEHIRKLHPERFRQVPGESGTYSPLRIRGRTSRGINC